MSFIDLIIIPPQQLAVAQTILYTNLVAKTIITKITITNTTGSNETFSVNLIPNGGTPGGNNLIISGKVVLAGQTYVCTEIMGHILETGYSISTAASSGTALTIYGTGRTIS